MELLNQDLIETNELSKTAKGGTELMLERIYHRLPRELLEQVQIIPTRVKTLDESKIRILYVHDLPGDPSLDHLKNKGWAKFHKIVFVSNWQMQAFIGTYEIPWSRCHVINNGIVPFEQHDKPDGKIKLIYTSTPHRGLEILVDVFEQLTKKYDNIELDVFSSFALYGWPDRESNFEALYQRCRDNPNINYYGTVNNNVIREALTKSHIFAYPSVWLETSCLCLIEARSAGLVCVHPNLGGLYETAAGTTAFYQFHESIEEHKKIFYRKLENIIQVYSSVSTLITKNAVKRVNDYYNIDYLMTHWEQLIESLLNEPKEIKAPVLIYDTSTRNIR